MYWYPEFTTATSLHVQIYILPQSSCRCWLQLRIGKVPNSVVGAIAVVMDENGFLMRSFRDVSDVSGEGCWVQLHGWVTSWAPQSGIFVAKVGLHIYQSRWKRIDPYPYMATHTHKNHETWFAYSQQAPMLTTWIDTILDSFIFALTRGSRWGFKAGSFDWTWCPAVFGWNHEWLDSSESHSCCFGCARI